ncbi:MAG TPA: hypothetical protein VFC63_27850 [Blastocatellia bacterium]|nr:hypothetical protein [Blastocatellia bacterium]
MLNLTYSFDNEGQTATKTDPLGTTQYQWDARGRLTSASLPSGQTVSYGYDALGRRSSRAALGNTTKFLYDGSDVVLDQSSGSPVEYLNAPAVDAKLKQSDGGGSIYFLPDHLGSTTALTDSNGVVVERLQYEPYGQSSGSTRTRYDYTGRERDQLTGMIFYRARWYDP